MNLRKNFKRVSRKASKHGLKNDNFVKPLREWLVGLTVAVVLFVGGGTYFFFDYRNSRAAMEIVPDVETTIIRYRQADIAYYLTALQAREAQHNKLRSQVFTKSPAVVVNEDVASSSEDQISE